ncbi:MAG: flagellar hook-length control protein FliK [Huintestinicola sp.]
MADLAGMLNVTLGMKGISNYNSGKDVFSSGSTSFGEVFSQAVNSSAEASSATETSLEDPLSTQKKATFAELVSDLKDKIEAADKSVINAAVKMLQSVGKAVEALFGTGSEDGSNEDKADTTASIFAILVNISTENKDETDTILDEALALLDEISELLDAGVEEKILTPENAVDELRKALSSKDDKNVLAAAVIDALCAMNGIGTGFVDELPEVEISELSMKKLSAVIDAAVSGKGAEEIENILNGAFDMEKTDESVVKFSKYLAKSDEGHELLRSIDINLSSLKINDAASQLDGMRPELFADAAPVDENAEDVFGELWRYASNQLMPRINEALSENDGMAADSVKELTVVLKPESLGEIAVKLATDANGNVTVTLAASNSEIGKAISDNAAALSEGLAKQNVKVNDVNVIEPSDAASYMGLDFTNQGFNRKEDGGAENGSGSGRQRTTGISAAEAPDEIKARNLLKEAKLWATA